MRLPDLREKVVFVTGAGRGIGAATVVAFLRAGARVVAGVLDDGPASELRRAARGDERLDVRRCDVTDTGSVAELIAYLQATYGRLDALVNNAGVIAPIGRIADLDPDAWTYALAVNAGGVMRCTAACLPLLLAGRGTVVNISSGAAYQPFEGWSAYCGSKAALVMFSRATALEYAEQGLRVFSLGIPPTDTAMQGTIRESGLNPISRIPKEHLQPAEKAASVIVWLAGPDAACVSTVEIDVRDALFRYLLEATS